MDVSTMLQMMRDRLGSPIYPPLVQLLLVVTWVLHIFFVTLAVGATAFTLSSFVSKASRVQQLALLTARITPNAVGLGIVTGIAPLLFVQTIYDPIWYATNSLTGFWSVTFIFIVMGGYGLSYLFYLKGQREGRYRWAAVVSFALLLFAGWIMHVLSSVSIHPENWQGWYAPDGIVDTRGITFHSFNVPRLGFLLPLQSGLSLAVVLLLVAWYFRRRDDVEPEFLDWVARLGRNIGLIMSPLYILFGLLWAGTQGVEFGLGLPVGLTLTLLGAGLLGHFWFMKDPTDRGPATLGVWLLGLLVVAVVREVIRIVSLERFGYSVADYPYTMDWGSILVFTVTTVVGVAVLLYLALVLYQSGAGKEGGTITPRVDRLGKVATGMLAAWFGFFLLVGLSSRVVLTPTVAVSQASTGASATAAGGTDSSDGDMSTGKTLFTAKGCVACHTVDGIPGASGVIGPKLNGIGDESLRPQLVDGRPNTPANLAAWIKDPQQRKPGTAMPTLGLSEKDSRDLAAFLGTLH